ncbi:MAG: MATE family efflux transporter [Burkholderiales bacterium]|nr:MATE family efflux transporter [Burkholderiales bacterium]
MPAAPSPKLWPLLWPLTLELLLGMLVGLAATLLAARVSDPAAAAFALANHISFTLFLLFRVVGAGIGVVLTQALGARQREAADGLALACLGASTRIGSFCAVLVLLGAEPLLRLMKAPPEALPLALPLLQCLAPALLLDAWNASMASVMRAHLRARDALMVLVAMNALQLLLALLLMPRLGLIGFALAVLARRLLALALHLLLWRVRLGLQPRAADWWAWRREPVAAMMHFGLPGAAENLAWRLSFMVSVAVVAAMGTRELAAHAYAFQVLHFLLIASLAIGLSMEIVIGHLVGAGRLHEADQQLRRAMRLAFLSAGGLSLAAALVAPWLMRAFTQDAAIVALGAQVLWLAVLLEPGRAFNLVVINALRAAGDARYPLYVGIGSQALVLAGGSWLLGSWWGLFGVFVAYVLDEWIRGLLMWRRWLRRDWLTHARAARRRVRALQRGT